MATYYIHMFKRAYDGEGRHVVLIGPKDEKKWEVGVEIRGATKRLLDDSDKELIGNYINGLIERRQAEQKKGMIVLPGTGLCIPANIKKGS